MKAMTDRRATSARVRHGGGNAAMSLHLGRRVALLSGLALAGSLVTSGCGGAAASPTGTAGSPSGAALPTSAAPPTAVPSAVASPAQAPSTSASASFGAMPTGTFDTTTLAALQAILDAAVERGAPDIMAAVITPGGTWSGAAGVGGPDARPVAAGDSYYVGAISQIFTAATTLRLAEQERIDLDAPIGSYLGNLTVDTNGATVRQVLAHRSGLPDFPGDTATSIQADSGRRWTVEEVIGHFAPATEPPGDGYVLAGPNYSLLAAAVAEVTGTSFAKAMRTTILDPVGSTRIVQQGEDEATPKPWALPIAAQAGAWKLEDYGAGDVISCISSVSFSRGYGAVASDAPSLAAWMWHLFAGDVVDAPSLRLMLPGPDGHGFGLDRLEGMGEGVAIGQIGSKPEYSAILAIWPAERTVAVVFVNDLEFIIDPVAVELRDVATGG
jgi:D-alanyl-D-alanine carboxypeptidase